jgi:HEPN domain-containing protein
MAQRNQKKKIEPEVIFLQGVNFHMASRALEQWKPSHPSGARLMHMPASVVNAFSSELLLKTLVCIETGRIPKGHHLLRLFNALSAKTRKRIMEM